MEPKTALSSIESLSTLSQTSNSPRLGSAVMSDDQFSLRSEDSKVRFMCSYGGRIMPRPHDCQLRFVGGETRILVVNRSIALADLMGKLTRLCGRSVQLKYQLPNEDMDSLVSVLSDEDLENMMEEFDRLEIREASARLRLFLFPAKSYSGGVDLPEYDARNAEQRFVDAVNGIARRQQSLPASQTQLPDYLFGLDMFEKQLDRQQSAPSKINSQPLPEATAGCFLHELGLLEKDHQLSLQNYPHTPPPQKAASFQKHQSTLLNPLICFSNPATISVADHSLEVLEAVNQPSFAYPVESTQASEKHLNSETTFPRSINVQKKSESVDSAQGLNLMPTSDDPHKPAKGSICSAQIEEKLQLKDSLTTHELTTAVLSKSVEFEAESKSAEFEAESKAVEANDSKARNQHLTKMQPEDLSAALYNEQENGAETPLKINKVVSDEVNGDTCSNFQGQKSDTGTELIAWKLQQQSSNKHAADNDPWHQQKGEKESEDLTNQSLHSYEIPHHNPYLQEESGQQQIISSNRLDHLKEGYIAFEDSEIPLRSTIAQYNNLQQQNLHNFQLHHQWQGEDRMTRHQYIMDRSAGGHGQLAPFFHPPTTSIPRAASAPIRLRTQDIPRSPHRQSVIAPHPTNLQRQLSSATIPYSELQQQQTVRIVGGDQSTGRDQAAAARIPRVQSPSRFRDRSSVLSTSTQGHWINPQQASRGPLLQPNQHDIHFVDPNVRHVLCDPSANSHFSNLMLILRRYSTQITLIFLQN